jgi:hypothetical protein
LLTEHAIALPALLSQPGSEPAASSLLLLLLLLPHLTVRPLLELCSVSCIPRRQVHTAQVHALHCAIQAGPAGWNLSAALLLLLQASFTLQVSRFELPSFSYL